VSDPLPITGPDEIEDVHRREVTAALREERRLLLCELVCLLVVAAFFAVRQLWLV
jgi:hypothetical protein